MSLVQHMAHGLGLPSSYIERAALRANHSYKTYFIEKRNGGKREIHHPSRSLKALQRWLASNVISSWPVHQSAMAYRKGRSIADNASAHRRFAYSLRLDLQGFFPSITVGDVIRFTEAVEPDWSKGDRLLFCRLVCRSNVLTIGAPTSPCLSNAICHELDCQLSPLLDQGQYTRYADDMVFSTDARDVLVDVPSRVETILGELSCPSDLRLNHSKTLHLSKRHRRSVTGVVIGSDGEIHLGRGRKREIRALVHQFESLDATAKARLAGLISHAASIDRKLVNDLVMKYGAKKLNLVLDGVAVDDL